MPFGRTVFGHAANQAARNANADRSPMPFGRTVFGHQILWLENEISRLVSPMPFGRTVFGHGLSLPLPAIPPGVSNAFRQDRLWSREQIGRDEAVGLWSPMPFGRTVFGHLPTLSKFFGLKMRVSNAFRQDRLWSHAEANSAHDGAAGLQCLSAGPSLVTRSGRRRRRWISSGLQCLSAGPSLVTIIDLSDLYTTDQSPMPFGWTVFGHSALADADHRLHPGGLQCLSAGPSLVTNPLA